MIGFLLRNRRFRKTAHEGQTEFVFQRWCPALDVRAPWALGAANVQKYRQTVALNLEALRRILPEADCTRLFSDPKWQHELPYHAQILAGTTPLQTRADFPLLLDSLWQGVAKAAVAAGKPVPAHPQAPTTEDIAEWDVVLCQMMDLLLEYDALARKKMASGQLVNTLWQRLRPWA